MVSLTTTLVDKPMASLTPTSVHKNGATPLRLSQSVRLDSIFMSAGLRVALLVKGLTSVS